ncbi:hypothetical protein GQ55_9G304800 [Panicum hallii var. hallii]|uniref:DUF7699 domain-containing protein n=1 Tax=Panicum hallii var. hallii TaxID=1504633 RepID=A0A2T7C7S2_9POAL|nr:hypothetical protein GQ55_9G304800 [Panicum hallii var. hallii]
MPIDVLTLSCASHTLRVKNDGEEKYPVSSFVLNCKGDACKGDVVMFEQNIYRRKKGAPREVKGRLCGQRTNAGRIINESYGTAKQQHTFTIEILWSKGYKPWPALHPLLIKGRNLYKDKTMRQPWPDELERNRVIQEKHERGDLARKSRAARIHEKENKKLLSLNRNRIKDNKIKEQHNMNQKQPQEPQQSQNVKSTNILQQRVSERKDPSPQNGEPGNTRQQHISSKATTSHHNKVFPQKGATRTFKQEFNGHQISSNQHGGSQLKVLSDPTHTQQMFKDNHHGYQQRNEVLPQEVPMRTSRKAFVDHQAPTQHNGGLGKTNHHQISSKPPNIKTTMKRMLYRVLTENNCLIIRITLTIPQNMMTPHSSLKGSSLSMAPIFIKMPEVVTKHINPKDPEIKMRITLTIPQNVMTPHSRLEGS